MTEILDSDSDCDWKDKEEDCSSFDFLFLLLLFFVLHFRREMNIFFEKLPNISALLVYAPEGSKFALSDDCLRIENPQLSLQFAISERISKHAVNSSSISQTSDYSLLRIPLPRASSSHPSYFSELPSPSEFSILVSSHFLPVPSSFLFLCCLSQYDAKIDFCTVAAAALL